MGRLKYSTMAKYVDDNVYKDNRDDGRIYKYLRKLAWMLPWKKQVFKSMEQYDLYAIYLANIVYVRLTDKRQELDPSDPKYLPRLKSCLNYMKAIWWPKLMKYIKEEMSCQDFKAPEDSTVFISYLNSNIVNDTFGGMLSTEIMLYFSKIDEEVKDVVYNGVYKYSADIDNIYISVLLTLLRSLTLSNRHQEKLLSYRTLNNVRMLKDNWEYQLDVFMQDEILKSPIVYDIPDEYIDYVAVMAQVARHRIIEGIKHLCSCYTVTDGVVKDILVENMFTGEREDV